MSVLLAADQVELYPPGTATDEHGWALPGDGPTWRGLGNLQADAGTSDPTAADRGGRRAAGGGAGPFAPAAVPKATLYLPPDADVHDGGSAIIRGQGWVLSEARLIADPTFPSGGLTCWVVTLTGWPAAVPSGF